MCLAEPLTSTTPLSPATALNSLAIISHFGLSQKRIHRAPTYGARQTTAAERRSQLRVSVSIAASQRRQSCCWSDASRGGEGVGPATVLRDEVRTRRAKD